MRWLVVGCIFLATGCGNSNDSTDSGQSIASNSNRNLTYRDKIKIAILGRKTIFFSNKIPIGEYVFQKDGTYTAFGDPPVTQKYYITGSDLCVFFEPTIKKCWKIDDIKRDGSLDATALSDKERVRFVPSSKLDH